MSATPLNKQDINVFHQLDFKCYNCPFDTPDDDNKMPAWSKLYKKGTAVSTIASLHDQKAGYAIWERGAKDKAAYIVRLGVLPRFRRQGVGRQILGWVAKDLRSVRKDRLRVVLSQATCLGSKDPDDVSGFMKKVGFRWIDSITDQFYQYGQHYDGLVFERKLV